MIYVSVDCKDRRRAFEKSRKRNAAALRKFAIRNDPNFGVRRPRSVEYKLIYNIKLYIIQSYTILYFIKLY